MDTSVSNQCPVRTTLEMLGGKWKLLLIKILADGGKRFSEITKQLPEVSEKVLNEELKDLVESNLVFKTDSGKPIYQLTPLGQMALPLLDQLAKFGKDYMEAIQRNP
ncbi:MAG: helix-turn-helix transcriptional regulator [Bacteroidia bacterium]|jgi:DNA-binding HxlR family transcriptional regulator|nr:helix-turn-helix transcriptional regulator [Bacteroidia bacterium]